MYYFKPNLYGNQFCTTCKSKNVLLKLFDDKPMEVLCIDCENKRTGQQGIIACRLRKSIALDYIPNIKFYKEIKIYKPFGWLFKWLSIHLRWNKNKANGIAIDLIYTEQFIPKGLLT